MLKLFFLKTILAWQVGWGLGVKWGELEAQLWGAGEGRAREGEAEIYRKLMQAPELL